jgi:hypothetical protein
MNHRSSGSLTLRKAIIGCSNHKTVEGLTERSVDSYKRDLEQWAAYAGDIEVAQITKQDIEAYLFYLRTEYVPHRFGGDTRALSPRRSGIFTSRWHPSSHGPAGSFGWKT